MLRTIDATRQILFQDEIALEALRQRILNLSAYASSIQRTVENLTLKKVQTPTIVVSLSRIAAQLQDVPALLPSVSVENVSIISPLTDISFEKTVATAQAISTLQSQLQQNSRKILMVTEGMSEITLIASQEYQEAILTGVKTAPLSHFQNLVGVSVRFSPEYLEIPNTLYSLMSKLATKRINVIEIVSTYTEVMFVVRGEDRDRVIRALS